MAGQKNDHAASDVELSKLHGRLAKSMVEALESADEAQALLNKVREIPLPPDVVKFLSDCAANSPSLMTAVAKFLKDNKVTCRLEDSEEMSALQQRLKEKKRIGNIVPIDEAG